MKRIQFKNSKGQNLSARINLPLHMKPLAYAIFAHCFTCNKNLNAVRNISGALTANGIAVLSFDFTGLGESEGDFEDSNFSSNVQDLIEAANYLNENYKSPQLLVGHSLGGAAVIFAASNIKSVKAVATIGAPSSTSHIKHLLHNSVEEIIEKGKAEVNIGGRDFTVKKQFLDDVESKNMKSSLKKLNSSLLIFHSPQDTIVGISNATEIYQKANHPKSFVSLDGADHLLSNKEDSNYIGQVTASWAIRYLKIKPKEKIKTRLEVTAHLEDEYTTTIVAGRHVFIADEPVSFGGNDFGPSPNELLLASLGACTAMTLKWYSKKKNWDLGIISVHLNYKNENNASEIERAITISGELNENQKQKLIEIANKCPVHKTLHHKVSVKTVLLQQ